MSKTFESDVQLGMPSPIPFEHATAARRTVAGNAVDADDARQLLDMLGLLPNNEAATVYIPDGYCRDCECPCVNNTHPDDLPEGFRRFARLGTLCTVCYRGTGVMRA